MARLKYPILVIVSIWLAWVGIGYSAWVFWLGIWAALNFIAGHEDWEGWIWVPVRYASPAVVAIAPGWFTEYTGLALAYDGFGYVICCVAAGVVYPALDKCYYNLGPYARPAAGALIMGGLVAL